MSDKTTTASGQTAAADEFRSDVRRLGRYVGQLHDDLTGIGRRASDVAHSGAAATKESGRNALGAVKRRSDLATVALRRGLVEHPGATLGIAVGVGILLGLMGPTLFRAARKSS